MTPDFYCVGTYRAGTTWLHRVFSDDNRIFLPSIKETMFFSHHWSNGLDWYTSLFQDSSNSQLRGEVCPTYFSSGEAPSRIASISNEPKIIIILRKPISQILSLYKLWRLRGYTEHELTLEFLINSELNHNVQYCSHLERYFEFFAKEDIQILLYEELSKDPVSFLNNIYSFLDLSPNIPSFIHEKTNQGRVAKFPMIDSIMAQIGDYLRHNQLHGVHRIIKSTGLVDLLKSANSQQNANSFSISSDIEEYVSSETTQLVDCLYNNYGIDSSIWLEQS